MQRFRLAHTHFDGATGVLDVTGGLLFKLLLVNVLGNALSLGLAFPWTVTYTLRTMLERTSFGAIDFRVLSATGGLATLLCDMLVAALGVELGV